MVAVQVRKNIISQIAHRNILGSNAIKVRKELKEIIVLNLTIIKIIIERNIVIRIMEKSKWVMRVINWVIKIINIIIKNGDKIDINEYQ
jgi:hypothetical protein